MLTIHPYDDLAEAIAFINDRPAALAAYWYGEDGDDFRRFLRVTPPPAVSPDGLLLASLSNAPFGAVGGSGTGAYGGKAGFDEFTHQRTAAARTGPQGFTDGMVGSALLAPELTAGIDPAITGGAAGITSEEVMAQYVATEARVDRMRDKYALEGGHQRGQQPNVFIRRLTSTTKTSLRRRGQPIVSGGERSKRLDIRLFRHVRVDRRSRQSVRGPMPDQPPGQPSASPRPPVCLPLWRLVRRVRTAGTHSGAGHDL